MTHKMHNFQSKFHSTSCRMWTIIDSKQTGRNWPQYTVFQGEKFSKKYLLFSFTESSKIIVKKHIDR